MKLTKKVEIGNNIYFIVVAVVYKKSKNNLPYLCLENYKYDDWDGGTCSILIDEVEKNFTNEKAKNYDKNISFMADVLYIYDRIPFITGIKDVYIFENKNIPYAEGYISKEEIDAYIKTFNIKMHFNSNFKLCDKETWYL